MHNLEVTMKEKMLNINESKKIRVIIDTDSNCEGDDQYAIAHALMCNKVEVVGIIAEHYGTQRDKDSMMKSYDEVMHILRSMDQEDIPLYYGTKEPMNEENQVIPSDGVNFIVGECK